MAFATSLAHLDRRRKAPSGVAVKLVVVVVATCSSSEPSINASAMAQPSKRGKPAPRSIDRVTVERMLH